MWTRMMRPVVAGALALALALVACDADSGDLTGTDTDTDSPVDGRSALTILLTDAPGDILEAWVTIASVEVVGDDGPVVLRDEPVTTDLLTLADDVATLVDAADVPDGHYVQLRFVIPEACIVVDAGDDETTAYSDGDIEECGEADGRLIAPGFAHSGLKVQIPGGVTVAGNGETLLVDFDVSESFGHQAGRSGNWVMRPVIRVERMDTDDTDTSDDDDSGS